MKKIRIVVADDHPMVRAGLRATISAQPDMEIVGEAEDGKQAIDRALEEQPDIVLMDLTMPEIGGVDATEVIIDNCETTRVLALTMHEATPFLKSFLAAGGSGYVLKKAAGKDLLTAIRTVNRGLRFLDPKLGPRLLDELIHQGRADRKGNAELSRREREVVQFVAQGYSSQQVADRMRISAKTVDSYRARISQKLGLKTRPEIVRYAIENGLLTQDDFIPEG
jgi:two-component system, NarL family, response regulator NreC